MFPRRDRGHQRREREHVRLVPGADDQRHAERVAADPDVAGLHQQRRVHPFWSHPAVQMLQRIVGLADVVVDVHQVGVGPVAAQVVAAATCNSLAWPRVGAAVKQVPQFAAVCWVCYRPGRVDPAARESGMEPAHG